ncbi:hypothetical protein TSUD_231920 [Trifolium subterraneum]|uniref:Uncharacterized protein n=1 Tax=Trifolium subterraneum TaxID=3900 RepID=A0A2Z6P335_TRISU|nr:hypothetical protein TSUD_231920 [Trifolium subterraneum]
MLLVIVLSSIVSSAVRELFSLDSCEFSYAPLFYPPFLSSSCLDLKKVRKRLKLCNFPLYCNNITVHLLPCWLQKCCSSSPHNSPPLKSLSIPTSSPSHLIVNINVLALIVVTLSICSIVVAAILDISVPPTNPTSALLLFRAKVLLLFKL